MGILVNHEIVTYRNVGHVVIEPFRPAQLNTNSYDVTLGQHIARLSRKTKQYFPVDLNEAQGAEEFSIEDLGPDGYLILQAGERCLAHTEEFIGGRGIVTTEMRARSSWGRWGMQACGCAGLGDVGYYNRYTCEIVNLNPFPVTFKVGSVFAQIVFHRVSPPTEGTSYDKTGQYQTITDLEELKAAWKPEMMLPKPIRVVAPEPPGTGPLSRR